MSSSGKIHVKQHIPNFVHGYEPVMVDIDTVEAIMDLEFVQRWKPAELLTIGDADKPTAFLMHEGWVVALITGASADDLLRIFPKTDLEELNRKYQERELAAKQARENTFEYQFSLYRAGQEDLDFANIEKLALERFGSIDAITKLIGAAVLGRGRIEDALNAVADSNSSEALMLRSKLNLSTKDIEFLRKIVDFNHSQTKDQ